MKLFIKREFLTTVKSYIIYILLLILIIPFSSKEKKPCIQRR